MRRARPVPWQAGSVTYTYTYIHNITTMYTHARQQTHRCPCTPPPSAPLDESPTAGNAAAAAWPNPPARSPSERERAARGAVSDSVTRQRQARGPVAEARSGCCCL